MTEPAYLPAIANWAKGDYGFQAAAQIATRTHLAESLIPAYMEMSGDGSYATLQFDLAFQAEKEGLLHLSSSAQWLLMLCSNLAHGNHGAGENLNLSGLWRLDPRNRNIVLDALRDNLAVPEVEFTL